MRILEFIKQNCKNVEFHALGDVCDFLKTSTLSKDKLIENGEFPVVNSSKEFYGYYDKFNNDGNTICVASRGNAGFVSYVEQKFWAGGLCYPFRSKNENNINTKFIFYFLKSKENSIISNLVSFGAIPALNKSDLQNFKIPVPSLEVQNKIVEVLDSFSSLVRSLVLEKTAREKQYKYYLNHLITNARNSRILKLGEVCEIKGRIGFRGYTTADMVKENQGAITLSPRNIINQKIDFSDLQFISWAKYEESPEIMIFENDVVFCKTGSTLGKVAIIENLPQKTTLNPQLVVFKNIKCNNRFLYYVVSTENFQSKAQSLKGVGAVPNISQGNLANIEFPLPPLDEQERIVRILDSLNELANGLSAGIPKEIELRQKQYEYWRDRLLEFPSKDSK